MTKLLQKEEKERGRERSLVQSDVSRVTAAKSQLDRLIAVGSLGIKLAF